MFVTEDASTPCAPRLHPNRVHLAHIGKGEASRSFTLLLHPSSGRQAPSWSACLMVEAYGLGRVTRGSMHAPPHARAHTVPWACRTRCTAVPSTSMRCRALQDVHALRWECILGPTRMAVTCPSASICRY